MDLLDLAILALRLLLVAVLYAFLVVVLRAAGRGLRAARPAPAPPARVGSTSFELRLIVLEAGGSDLTPGEVIETADGATLGRTEPADIELADAAVSGEHARLSRVGQQWVVRDLGSTNGTLVNDARVNGQTRLKQGDILAVGGVRFKVAIRSSSHAEEG